MPLLEFNDPDTGFVGEVRTTRDNVYFNIVGSPSIADQHKIISLLMVQSGWPERVPELVKAECVTDAYPGFGHGIGVVAARTRSGGRTWLRVLFGDLCLWLNEHEYQVISGDISTVGEWRAA